MELVRPLVAVVKLAFALALMGQLKACTLEVMGKAAAKHEMISYSKFNKLLTGKSKKDSSRAAE